MSKCKNCGRKGLFLKVNSEGLCANCSALKSIELKIEELESDIETRERRLREINDQIFDKENNLEKLKKQIVRQKEILDEYKTKQNDIYNIMKGQAEIEAVTNIKDQIDELEEKRLEKASELKKLNSSFNSLQIKYQTIKTRYDSYKWSTDRYIETDMSRLDLISSDSLSPTVEIDLQCMTVKQLRKLYNENKQLIQACFSRYSKRYTTKTNASLYKLMTIALEAELQNIIFSIKFGKLESSIDEIKAMCERYLVIATDGNQSIAPTVKKFIGEVEYLFIEAVKIEYEYYVQKERIKEEQRAIREQMKQEAEERKALEQERKRIEREAQKYQNEIEKIQEQLKTADAEQEKVLYGRIAELEVQINLIEDKKEQIVSLENGKAGYVYIVSNIGSFGNDVYKIGMTRRLEPMDRINELGNASVPFPFDVHGLIFSDDAVQLEHDLHMLFNDNRVNKVNLRKEFFSVSLDEIEKVVDERCPSAEFHRTALAEQYRQSMAMSKAADELDNDEINISFE